METVKVTITAENPNHTVFPTCVGMNRIWPGLGSGSTSVPHMRGDEP